MKPIQFQWDEKKSKANKKKHGVSFEEAQTVFFDEDAIEFFDPGHSTKEDRFLMLGISSRLRVLVVAHCYRSQQELSGLYRHEKQLRRNVMFIQGERNEKRI